MSESPYESDGVPVGKKEQGRFGFYVAAKVLPYYKEYFGVEYPLPKMDLVAVYNTMWMVPIEVATSRSPTTPSMSFVLEGETAEIVLNDIRPDEWFKVQTFSNLSVGGY